jgi:hypothetical protein
MPVWCAQSAVCRRAAARCGLVRTPNGMYSAGTTRCPAGCCGTRACWRARVRTPGSAGAVAPEFMYRLDRACHSWQPDCQSCRPFA